jgi:hypothetical protein
MVSRTLVSYVRPSGRQSLLVRDLVRRCRAAELKARRGREGAEELSNLLARSTTHGTLFEAGKDQGRK